MVDLGKVLVEEYRGNWLECAYTGHMVGVNEQGEALFSVGDENYVSFMRSSSKPVQALPALMAGVPEHYGLSDEEIVLMTASHRAQQFHVEALESFMRKTGISESQFVCKPTYPLNGAARDELIAHGEPARSIYHNCSGKHLGVLALCKMKGWPTENYAEQDHPVQQQVLSLMSALSDVPVEQIRLGTDGCGFPVYALPIRNIATLYLRLACPDLIPDEAVRAAVIHLTTLMNRYPFYVSGTQLICPTLLQDDNIVAKGGAKGIYCFGLRKERMGIAFKVMDGSEDQWPLIAAHILKEIGYPNAETIERLRQLSPPETKNDNGRVVGMREAKFELKWVKK
ncbi:asparaginase [Paenibacillus thiaminolyticus]|uniref:asparaginase n=1 Tax=Paenibacillus thiaminolyticus TaxID=49283 RepID=UPI0035A59601